MNNNSSWKKIIDGLNALFFGLTAACAILGVIIAYLAVEQYKNQNNAQMIHTFLGSDTEISKLMTNNAYLHGFFAISLKDQDAKSIAIQKLKIIINDNHDNICDHWKDIPELYEKMFELDDFNNNNKQKLRAAYFAADAILDDIQIAFEAKYYNLIKKEDYETYTGYFAEIGEHPLFLCAIYWNHKNGYITKDFAKELVNKLLADPKRKRTIEVIYPDILKENWVDRVGERK